MDAQADSFFPELLGADHGEHEADEAHEGDDAADAVAGLQADGHCGGRESKGGDCRNPDDVHRPFHSESA
ncbi:MAG TPA: hypothetical protein VMR43_09340 [Variovorax sp.]|nr:hypothetical protein [Variovorax sp.]